MLIRFVWQRKAGKRETETPKARGVSNNYEVIYAVVLL